MEYGGEKSLNDLIEERNKDSQDPFPAAIILKVALNMARGLKVTVPLYFKWFLWNMKELLYIPNYKVGFFLPPKEVVALS